MTILQTELHKTFLKKCITASITTIELENIQMTILYFIIGSLKMLGELTTEIKFNSIIYVLSQIVIDNKSEVYILYYLHIEITGFRASNFTGFSNNINYILSNKINKEDSPHLASTYSALSILSMCDINPTEINQLNQLLNEHYNNNIVFDIQSIAKEVSLCQRKDGSFNAQNFNGENDVRFTYCALCILKYIGLSSKDNLRKYININNCLNYLNSTLSYEGGYSMIQGGESNGILILHYYWIGGLTYCSVASYILLDADVPCIDTLIHWVITRASDIEGVTGRTNKVPDSCYSYWIFATIVLLKKYNLVDEKHIINFLLQCQTVYGGFSKFINLNHKNFPDLLHTFYSIATLSLLK